ncbi:MAG: hypothetical protein SW833_27465 [Cyanobacteriota bacterium]|nr:hypothetical protein [Cyanobacteriota bacterium]
MSNIGRLSLDRNFAVYQGRRDRGASVSTLSSSSLRSWGTSKAIDDTFFNTIAAERRFFRLLNAKATSLDPVADKK